MKIIKDTTALEYTCLKCDSVLEVGDRDLFHENNYIEGKLVCREYYICPCCGYQNTVKTD